MKKVFLAIAVVAVFTACNNGGETEAAKDSTAVTPVDSTLKVADSTVKAADSTVKVMDSTVKAAVDSVKK